MTFFGWWFILKRQRIQKGEFAFFWLLETEGPLEKGPFGIWFPKNAKTKRVGIWGVFRRFSVPSEKVVGSIGVALANKDEDVCIFCQVFLLKKTRTR